MPEDTHPRSLDLEQEEVHPGARLVPLVLSSHHYNFWKQGPAQRHGDLSGQ